MKRWGVQGDNLKRSIVDLHKFESITDQWLKQYGAVWCSEGLSSGYQPRAIAWQLKTSDPGPLEREPLHLVNPLAHADIWFQIVHVYEQQKDLCDSLPSQHNTPNNLRQHAQTVHAQTVHADKQEQNERMMRELTSLHASMAAANKTGQPRGKRGQASINAAAVLASSNHSGSQDSSMHGLDQVKEEDLSASLHPMHQRPGDWLVFIREVLNMHTTISIYHQLGIWIETVDAAYAIAALHHLIHHHPPHTYTSPPWLCSLSCPAPGRVSWRVCVGDLWCIRTLTHPQSVKPPSLKHESTLARFLRSAEHGGPPVLQNLGMPHRNAQFLYEAQLSRAMRAMRAPFPRFAMYTHARAFPRLRALWRQPSRSIHPLSTKLPTLRLRMTTLRRAI
ncbi:hypothetical protein EV424DRAFT_1353126 [Suillus variegatus]|nr:hypothetical protein EV424DRAFT_1353126 [Suillus variegatus]